MLKNFTYKLSILFTFIGILFTSPSSYSYGLSDLFSQDSFYKLYAVDPNADDDDPSFKDFVNSHTNLDDFNFNASQMVNNLPVNSTVLPGSLGALLCDFRNTLRGKVTVVIIAVSIFMCGILILMQKMKWTYAVLIVGCIALLLNAEQLIRVVMGNVFSFPLLFCVHA